MFNIEFIRGDIKSALTGPHDIVVTEEMATKYFGDEEPIGKTLTSMGYVFTVTGVVKSMPSNSHIKFDFLLPFEFLFKPELQMGIANDWPYTISFTYIELSEGANEESVNEKIKDFVSRKSKASNSEIFLQNIKKIHLFSYGKYVQDMESHSNITYVRIMSLIAVLILMIACINFTNLSTAQSERRSREIGIRKISGANKQKIFIQFIGESLLIVFVAHIIAMIVVELLLPAFNNLVGKQLYVNYQSIDLYVGLFAVVFFCSLLAGSYPALYLSSLKPLQIIKGVTAKNSGKPGLRMFLVISQFSLSCVLIISTLIIGNQLNYLQNKNLGLNRDNMGCFMFTYGLKRETLKSELNNTTDITNITIAIQYNAFNNQNSTSNVSWEGKKENNEVWFNTLLADKDYAETFRLELKAGRFLSSDEFSSDNAAVVINERAAEIIGFKDPVGQRLIVDGVKLTIIGVVKDFHFKSLHISIEPLLILSIPPNMIGGTCFIRMKPERFTSVIEHIKEVYKSHNLNYPLDFRFVEDDYNNLYQTEQRMSKIFDYFSFLAIIISCLGLIGLSTFMTERRTKEIGIRKANGAKSIEIFSLLSKEYIILVIISFLIASPIAWYVMNSWLQNFAYRINIGWWVFALTGVIVLLITMLTVGFQSYRAASKNPVEALRYE
jgi:ABC-type antimicrobial peptide transport system permease subunit